MTQSRLALLAATTVVLLVGSVSLRGDDKESAWTTSYPGALKQAKAAKKIVLADFTGSDWCGYCIKLKKDVLDTAEFLDWAKQKLVLLELDFPHKKQLSDDQKKQNTELQKKFKVTGFPTIVLLDGDGNELGRVVGYSGKEAWVKQVKAIVEKK